MKKNALSKMLLLLVMLMLVFSLCACSLGGGGNDNGGGNGGSGSSQLTTPKLGLDGSKATWNKISGAGSYEVSITSMDGEERTETTNADTREFIIAEGDTIKVRAVPSDSSRKTSEWSNTKTFAVSATKQLVNLIKGINGIITTLNNTKKDSTLSAEATIQGYFTAEKTNTIALAASAKANDTDPQFSVDFKLNDKEYFTLGYTGRKVFLREPLNLVNNSNENAKANAFVMDVTALEPSVKSLMKFVMNKLDGVTIDFDVIADSVVEILDGFEGVDFGKLLAIKDNEDGSKEIGLTVTVMKTALNLIPGLFKDMDIKAKVNEYIGYANKALEVLKKDPLTINGKELNWANIEAAVNAANTAIEKQKKAAADMTNETAKAEALAAIKESLVKIKVTYNNKKVINKLILEADLEALQIQNLDYKAGLSIDLPTFELANSVSVSVPTGFSAQDLEIDLSGILPLKSLSATAKGVIRLSDAFANKNNKWATVTVDAHGKESESGSAMGYIDANGAYVDFNTILDLLGVTGKTAKFKQEYTKKNDAGAVVKMNLVDEINAAAKKLEPATTASAAAPRSWDEYKFDLNAIIDGLGKATDKIDYVCNYVYNNFVTIIDKKANENANANQGTLIDWAFNYEIGDEKVQVINYVKFYFTTGQAKTFKVLGQNISAIHDANKTILTNATKSEDKTAGIQLVGTENSLLAYLSKFVKIPTINESDEIDWDTTAEITDTTALKKWLGKVLPTTNKGRQIAEDILGKSLDAVIDDGLYLEAIGGEGYHGTVRGAASMTDATGYFTLGAGFGMAESKPDNMTAIVAETDFDQKDGEDYIIAKTAEAMLDGLRAYNKVSA